jgi:hypothetical protein
MASGFPGSIDSFTNPLTTSPLNSPSHAGQHQDLNDAVNKIETYMGLVKVIPTGATNGTVSADGDVTIGNAVSSVTVSGAFSSLYDNYRIILTGGSNSSGTALSLTLGATATGYNNTGLYVQFGTTAVTGLNVTNGTAWTNMGRGSANGLNLVCDLFDPFNTRRTGLMQIATDLIASGFFINQSGFLDNATSYTAFTITPVAGTMTGGTIRVYGYRN